jgi:hypothetical protein
MSGDLVLEALARLEAGQSEILGRVGSLEAGQSELLQRVGNLESGQSELLGRVGNLESGQVNILVSVGTLKTGQAELLNRVGNVESGQAAIAENQRAFQQGLLAELGSTRIDLMSRFLELQRVVTAQHEERIVDIGWAERAERLANAARDDAAAVGAMVTPLVRIVHALRTELDDLAEQVRALKAGRAP